MPKINDEIANINGVMPNIIHVTPNINDEIANIFV